MTFGDAVDDPLGWHWEHDVVDDLALPVFVVVKGPVGYDAGCGAARGGDELLYSPVDETENGTEEEGL